MNYRNRLYKIFLLALLFQFGTHTLRAQDPQQTQPQDPQQPQPQEPPWENTPPKPAGVGLPPFDLGDLLGNPNNLQPDYTPLTSMLNAGLGFPDVKHSYWVPGVQVSSSASSNLFGASNTSGWYETNYVVGNISLLEAWSRSQLAINYSGGGAFSTDSTVGNSGFQQLAFAESFKLDRWIIQIVDEFAQLPQSGFGFGVGTGLGIPGVGGSLGPTIPTVGNNYSPNDTIFSEFGPRYSNVAVAEATYQLTRRSSLTASGAYGILHFVDAGNIDTDTFFGSLGYNYQLSHKDSIGAYYEFSTYHFPGNPQAYGVQTASAAYSRKITGRLALSLYGGPQFTSVRVPVGTTSSIVNGYASAFLNYAFENGGISGRYMHGISGGGGLLTGSILDEVTFTVSRRLSRQWSAGVHFGYAHNRSVINPTGTVSNPSYDNWFVGASIGRPIGRNLAFSLAYTANFETNNPGCSSPSIPGCGASSNTTGQVVTLNFRWHPRPFALE
ncbi:MAG: hypothetical protein WBQ89_14995 [Candidatus Acidiferrum sp.]